MRMRRVRRTAVLFYIIAVLLAGTAFANSAPPDYLLVVRLANAPEEPYLLDILAEGDASDGGDSEGETSAQGNGLLDLLRSEVPEGWRACTAGSSGGIHADVDLAGEDDVHRFSGLDTPRRFRILIVTESGEVWQSDTMERRAVQDAVTVDWAAKRVSVTPVWLAVALQTLSTLLPTFVIEGLLLLAFRFDWKRNRKPFLLVNLVTQGALAIFLSTHIVQSGVGGYGMLLYGVLLIPAELVIAFAEAALYAKLFRGQSAIRAFAYGLTANAASYLLGLFTVQAVWEGFVRALWLGV